MGTYEMGRLIKVADKAVSTHKPRTEQCRTTLHSSEDRSRYTLLAHEEDFPPTEVTEHNGQKKEPLISVFPSLHHGDLIVPKA